MAENFDPYKEWLGIQERTRPLTNYQLLGLRPFEARSQAIEEGARGQLEKLSAHLKGDRASLAKRVAFELESAKVCLMDAGKRAAYDAMLRSRAGGGPAKPRPQPGAPGGGAARAAQQPAIAPLPTLRDPLTESLGEVATPTPASLGPNSLSIDDDVYGAPRISLRRKKAGRPPWVLPVAVGVGGFAAIAMLAFAIVSLLRGNPQDPPSETVESSVAEEPLKAEPLKAEPLVTGHSISGNPPSQPPVALASKTDGDALGSAAAKDGPRPAAPGSVFGPSRDSGVARVNDPPNAAMPGDDFIDLSAPSPAKPTAPKAVAEVSLPSLGGDSAGTFVPLGSIAPLGYDVSKLAVLNCLAGTKEDVWFRAEPVAVKDCDKAWQIAAWRRNPDEQSADTKEASESVPVAQVALRENKLSFRWLPEAKAAPYRRLQNCVLSLQSDDQSHKVRLRECKDIGPLTLDLGEEVVRFPIEGDALPDDDLLKLEVLELTGFPTTPSLTPGSSISGTKQPLRILVMDCPPKVEVRMQLMVRDDKAKLQISPVTVEAGKPLVPFTGQRYQTLVRNLPDEIAATNAGIAACRTRLRQLSLATPKGGTDAERAVNAMAIQDEFRDVNRRLAGLNRRLPVLVSKLEAAKPLIELGNKLHQRAQIRFRVYYVADGHEVELLKAY